MQSLKKIHAWAQMQVPLSIPIIHKSNLVKHMSKENSHFKEALPGILGNRIQLPAKECALSTG